MLVAGLAVTSCQDEDFGFNADQIAYETLFKKSFGEIDPNHDWNAAEKGAITVNPGASSNFKIYAKIGSQYQLVANYEDVTSTQELSFDAVDGTKEVMVSDGMTAQVVSVGGSANFGGTRATITGTTLGVTVTQTPEYAYFKDDIAKAFTKVCPEGKNNTSKVTSNYTLVSNGEFTIYPVYYQSGSWSNIGMYYKDANGNIQRVEFYQMKHGDDFQWYNSSETWDAGLGGYRVVGWTDFTTNDQDADHGDKDHPEKNVDPYGYKYRSKGITLNLPRGTVFGFYIYVHNNNGSEFSDGGGWYNYSETDLNNSSRYTTTAATMLNDGNNVALSGFYTVGNKTFFSFEDWNGDSDLNDMVFVFDGDNIPTPIDNTATDWLIACEDLNVNGSFDDEDFNDIVLKITHGTYKGNGYTTMQVTPLAAVGTYRSDIYVTSAIAQTDSLLGEIHELVDPSAREVSKNLYDVINGETVGNPGISLTVPCPSNFSLDSYVPGNYNSSSSEYAQTLMGGIKIKSYRSEEDNSAEDAKTIAPNNVRGTAGAMFCIPASWLDDNHIRHTWAWPKETRNISTVYPRFTDWVGNMSENTDWYTDTPVTDKAVSGYYTVAESNSETIDEEMALNKLIFLTANPKSVVLEAGGVIKTVTLETGSTGDITMISGSGDYFTAELSNKTITITSKEETGNGSIVIQQAAAGNYPQQQITIPVTVEAAKEASGFNVDPTSLSLTTIDAAQTITIKSKNNNLPAIADRQGSAAILGTITTANSGNQDSEGFYSWTLTVTPDSEGEVSFYITQASNATYKAGEQEITIEVEKPNLGTEITFEWVSNSYYYQLPLSEIKEVASSGNITITINFNGSTTYQLCGDTNAFGDYHGSFGYASGLAQITVSISDLESWYSSNFVKLSGGREEWGSGLTKVYVKAN